jgi:hypothetical protein
LLQIARTQSNAFALSEAVRRASYAILDYPKEETMDKKYKLYVKVALP